MKKIPTLFERDHTKPGAPVTETVNPECAWVFEDPERVTVRQKLDGTCVLFDDDGTWWARRQVKPGRRPVEGFRPVETDPVTGRTFGWVPIAQSPFVEPFTEALEGLLLQATAEADVHALAHVDPVATYAILPAHQPGTYELIGPRINGNPERCERHDLVAHEGAFAWSAPFVSAPQDTFREVRDVVRSLWDDLGVEGLVYAHDDGRRAKIKARDFGWAR